GDKAERVGPRIDDRHGVVAQVRDVRERRSTRPRSDDQGKRQKSDEDSENASRSGKSLGERALSLHAALSVQPRCQTSDAQFDSGHTRGLSRVRGSNRRDWAAGTGEFRQRKIRKKTASGDELSWCWLLSS